MLVVWLVRRKMRIHWVYSLEPLVWGNGGGMSTGAGNDLEDLHTTLEINSSRHSKKKGKR